MSWVPVRAAEHSGGHLSSTGDTLWGQPERCDQGPREAPGHCARATSFQADTASLAALRTTSPALLATLGSWWEIFQQCLPPPWKWLTPLMGQLLPFILRAVCAHQVQPYVTKAKLLRFSEPHSLFT